MTTRLVLAAVLALGLAAPVFGEAKAADAERRAHEGDLEGAIRTAKAAFEKTPSAHVGRLLQDLLAEAGRDDEREAVAANAPEPLRSALEARLLQGKEAVRALSRVLRTEGIAACFRLDLVRARLAVDKAPAASSEASRYVEEFPRSVEGHVVLAEALAERGKPDAAREAYERAIELHAGHPAATVGLASLLAREGEPGGRAAIEKALGIYPGNVALRFGLAEEQVREGDLKAGTETLQQILSLPTAKGPVHTRLGEVWRLRQDYEKSASHANAALADKSLRDPHRVRALRTRGFAKQKKGDLPGARRDYVDAIKLAPDRAQLHVDLGFALILSDNIDGALVSFERALELDENLADAHLKHGIALFLSGQAKKAKKAFQFVLKEDEYNLPANRYLGYLLLSEGKAKQALEHFQMLADRQSDDSRGIRMVGRCYMEMGKVDAALDAFQTAVDRDPKDAFAMFDLGKAWEKKENWEQAEKAYRRAIEIDGKLSHPHLYLAELLDYQKSDEDAALEHYEKFLELGGKDENENIQQRIEQIKDK